METLYSALEREIGTFVGHVQQCQQDFDLCSLYRVLLLVLPQSPSGQVESWQHLQRLSQHQPGSASTDVASYVGWLASYLQHLSVLKEKFDIRVVAPLCENLYVHEKPATHPAQLSPKTSIPHLAAQLFRHRRNWGLLLQGGALSEWVFSPQSLCDLRGFASIGPFVKVLRLVPDVFHQSLATAELARQWVHLHRNRYSLSLPPSPPSALSLSPPPSLPQQSAVQCRAGLAPSTVQPPLHGRAPRQPSSPLLQLQDMGSRPEVLWAQLQKSQEELLDLLRRGERANTLRDQVCHVVQRIHALRMQQQNKGTELALPQQSPETEDHWHQAALAEELQKSLELEEYHHSILEADWLLELEVRPILIRRIHVVQQHCWDLERMLWDQEPPSPQQAWLRRGMATTPVPKQPQPSATHPTAAASPRSSQQPLP